MDIFMHTQFEKLSSSAKRESIYASSTYVTRSKTRKQFGVEIESGLKRKSYIKAANMTVSKKQKLSNETGLPLTEEILFVKSSNENDSEVNKLKVAEIEFSCDEIVWGKLRGSPHWPCQIISNLGRTFLVRWYNDNNRTSKLFRTQLFKFLPNFEKYIVRNFQHRTA